MAIIKSHNTHTILKDSLVLDLGDVVRQAKRVRELTEAKARSLIADAQRDVEVLRKKVRDESIKKGYEEGLEKGLEEGRQRGQKEGHQEAIEETKQQLQQIEQAWIDAVHRWDSDRVAMERDARRAVLELALRLAEKVVHRVIEVDEKVIVDQLSAVLSHVLRPMDVTVNICSQDRPVLEEVMPRLLAEFGHVQRVNLVDDTAIGRGGCVVSYGQGQIDAAVDKQLCRVVETIAPNRVQAEEANPFTEDQSESEVPDAVSEGDKENSSDPEHRGESE